MDEIKLQYVTIKYIKPVVYFTFTTDTELGFPEIKELVSCAEKLSGGVNYFTLADIREISISVTNEGRRMVKNNSAMPFFRGNAVVVKNNLYKYTIDFLASISSSIYPLRAFTSKEEAVNWLLTLPLN